MQAALTRFIFSPHSIISHLYKKVSQSTYILVGGEGGIRTLGSGLAEQQISSLSLSTTQTPLQDLFIIY